MVSALAVLAGAALAVWTFDGPEVDPATAAEQARVQHDARRQAVVQARRAPSEAPEAAPAAVASVRSTGTERLRADPTEDRQMARVNRELLVETTISDLERAAAHAEAEGHPQRAELMRRRVAALERTLSAERQDPTL